ncbi:DUF3341 domain-containing protein [soil metagenome]
MDTESEPQEIYGYLAGFRTAEELISAVHRARTEGYRRMEAHSPFPVEGLAEALGFRKNRLPMIVFIGGVLGALGGYFLQYYTAVHVYPLNVGGRPLHSWPAFIPVTFECTILGAALSAVLGMLWLNGLPMPYHPLFAVPEFERASRDRFFLFIRHDDPLFKDDETRRFFETMAPETLSEVYR